MFAKHTTPQAVSEGAACFSNNIKANHAELTLAVGGYSRAGIKEENQDAFASYIPKGHELVSKGASITIADGVSSAENAAQASQMAVTQFIAEYYATSETWSVQKSAAKVLKSLNQWLNSQPSFTEQPIGYGTKQNQSQWLTTFSALVLKSATAHIFHVGDTRISKFSQKKLSPLTRDHNCKLAGSQMVLTRALGADLHLDVDYVHSHVSAGDIFILSCDGVHDFVSDAQMKKALSTLSLAPSRQELESVSQSIVECALCAGSNDNVSCVLVYIKSIPSQNISEIYRELASRVIPPALKVGQSIDNFTVKKLLHASVRSHLYLVEHIDSEKIFVLKTPSVNFIDDAIYLQGFAREAWVGEKINHPNIMQVIKTTKKSKFLYHLCEHIDGQSLTEWMHDNPKPSIATVRSIITQVISALRAFQRNELVHRDLKPDNIIIDSFGQVRLIDYGTVSSAALNELHETLREEVPQGTLNYVAPETLLTLKADHQSDMFSLAVVCYQMLCKELPYKPMLLSETHNKAYHTWRYRSIRQFRADIPLWLDLCLENALQANPADRFQAFSELETALSTPTHTALDEYQQQPLIKRYPVQFWQCTSLLLLLALVATAF